MRGVSLGSQCYSGEKVVVRFVGLVSPTFSQYHFVQDEEFSDVNGTLYMSNEDLRETLIEMNDPEQEGW